jgi:RNA polymerase sigma factor (sigma-70 family)
LTSCGAAGVTPSSIPPTRTARCRASTTGAELAIRRDVVRAALATLDARERDLVALKFAGGLSNAEIARVLGMTESNAGTRLHRTVTKLRKACDELA